MAERNSHGAGTAEYTQEQPEPLLGSVLYVAHMLLRGSAIKDAGQIREAVFCYRRELWTIKSFYSTKKYHYDSIYAT